MSVPIAVVSGNPVEAALALQGLKGLGGASSAVVCDLGALRSTAWRLVVAFADALPEASLRAALDDLQRRVPPPLCIVVADRSISISTSTVRTLSHAEWGDRAREILVELQAEEALEESWRELPFTD